VNEKTFSTKNKWMAKIAQWRERKIVHVNEKKILDENGWK
jgi:hypothetical protein